LPYKDPEKSKVHRLEYSKRPEVNERKRQYDKEYGLRPGVKERKRQYDKEYGIRPGVKERKRQYSKEYVLRPGVKERIKKLAKDEREKVKYAVLSHYSKKLSNSDIPCCNCCGEHDFLIFLTIDHITNRKNATHKKRLVGQDMYRYLRRNGYPLGYQVLCVNCNSAKSDSGICPHKRSSK